MSLIACLQCNKVSENSLNRLVQDSCGHRKCRVCLLQDEENCQQCLKDDVKKFKFNNNNDILSDKAQIDTNRPVLNNTQEPKTIIVSNKQNLPEASSFKHLNGSIKQNRQTDKKKKTINILNLSKHITVDSNLLSYHCTICNKSFTTKDHVKYHTYCAGAVKPHKCNLCLKEFILKTQYDIHMLKHNQNKAFICNICNKGFYEKSKLNRHYGLHSSSKNHICSECGKGFRSKESLKVHYVAHKGDKPLTCSVCPAKFNNLSNLKRHLISHTSEKNHMCDQCGKRFKLKWALSVHRRSHLRIRPFECSNCSKSFANNKDLQRHVLIHMESKAYSCSECKLSFNRKDNLSRHIKNTHPGMGVKIIKTELKKPPEVPKPVDNPNAINVITASPALCKAKIEKDEKIAQEAKNITSRAGSVINGPPKLMFKTSAFRHHYNIQRDSSPKKTDSVEIWQKILSSSSANTEKSEKTDKIPLPSTSASVSQNILSTFSTEALHYETSFQNRKHAMIKNIKFKVPKEYTQYSKPQTATNEGVPTESSLNIETEFPKTKIYAELKPVANIATSVIVNNNNQPASMHWRRRTSQNLNLKN